MASFAEKSFFDIFTVLDSDSAVVRAWHTAQDEDVIASLEKQNLAERARLKKEMLERINGAPAKRK